MAPRITLNLTADGELEIWLNPEGRDVLVKELQGLSERNDHFHFGPSPSGEVEVSSRAYRPDESSWSMGKSSSDQTDGTPSTIRMLWASRRGSQQCRLGVPGRSRQ